MPEVLICKYQDDCNVGAHDISRYPNFRNALGMRSFLHSFQDKILHFLESLEGATIQFFHLHIE